jgi:hypothetical protein
MATNVYKKEELSPNKPVKPKRVIKPSLQHYSDHLNHEHSHDATHEEAMKKGKDEARRSVIEKLQQTYSTKNFDMDHSPEDTPTMVTKIATREQQQEKVHGDRCSKKNHHKVITKDLHDGSSTRVEGISDK